MHIAFSPSLYAENMAILDICQITGYYAFANRLADGLGVALVSVWGNDPAYELPVELDVR